MSEHDFGPEKPDYLLPCPFCGGEYRGSATHLPPRMEGPGALISFTIRHWCFGSVSGAVRSTREVRAAEPDWAIQEWNRRSALRAEREGRMTRDEALAYFTPHTLTKGPVMLDPEKMREAVTVLAGVEASDPDTAGLELTEQICFDKVKKERDAYREALKPFAKAGELFPSRGEDEWDMLVYSPAAGKEYSICGDDLRRARSLLSQPTEEE